LNNHSVHIMGSPKDDGTSEDRATTSTRDGANAAASFAHEINNPLDVLLKYLYLIDREPGLSEAGRHYLDLAQDEARRMSLIAHRAIGDLQQRSSEEDTDVAAVLSSVIEFYRSRFTALGVSVKSKCCSGGHLRIYSVLLRQTFSNLLLNSLDALRAGGEIQTRVSTAREWSGENRDGLRVTFADNGCGIQPADLRNIFAPYFSTKGTSGNGIGLALVHHTVQKHRGTLRVRSSTREGRSGTVFSIFLPFTNQNQGQLEAKSA
jgi:signal transduction histidine kinase